MLKSGKAPHNTRQQKRIFVSGGGGDSVMLGTLGASPIEILPLEVIELR